MKSTERRNGVLSMRKSYHVVNPHHINRQNPGVQSLSRIPIILINYGPATYPEFHLFLHYKCVWLFLASLHKVRIHTHLQKISLFLTASQFRSSHTNIMWRREAQFLNLTCYSSTYTKGSHP